MIAVTGASGNIGGELLRILSEAGERVRALSRNPPSGATLDGVEWVRADLRERDTLAAAFSGADRLFLLTGNVEGMVPAQKDAVAAATAAGIEHVVKVSALGASDHSSSVIGIWHYIVEEVLKRADVDWTILRPHVFMQNILDQRKVILEHGEVYSPSGDAAVPMIDTRDVAAVAASVLTEPGHAGARYTLTGPQPVSWSKVAIILSNVLGRTVTYVPETENDAWHRLHRAGAPPWLIGAQLSLATYQRRGGGTNIVTTTVEEVTGKAARSFTTFARDHAADFADPP
jgi:uncharacterized protein YbjT (DUF2867 family)